MEKVSKSQQREYVRTIYTSLQYIATSEGIDTIDTFDRELASKLRTVSGAARDALTYMQTRGL